MLDIIEAMMGGDPTYPRAFVSAKEFWSEFYSNFHSSGGDLQKPIEDAQLPFCWKMEKDANLLAPGAKSIMALTAIGALYNDGFEDEPFAKEVIKAFLSSKTLSTGVIGSAKEVEKLYSLDRS